MKEIQFSRSVFVSSTTLGLGEHRVKIKNVMQKQNLTAVEQTFFEPEQEKAYDLIAAALDRSSGVLCLIGPYFGLPLEPVKEGLQRRISYTQWEFLETCRRNKTRRVYLIEKTFFSLPLDDEASSKAHMPDAIHFSRWQAEFREYVREHHAHRPVHSPEELWYYLAMTNWNFWP